MRLWPIGLLVLLAFGSDQAAAQSGFEAQPVLKASDLVAASSLTGPNFSVDERVPTPDYLGHFTLRSSFGDSEVHGRDLLAARIAEVGALDQLSKMSKTDEFLKAAGTAAQRPFKAAADIAAHPVETAKGTPAAVGRFFDRVQLGAKRVAASASGTDKSTEEKAEAVTKRVGGLSADVLGYEQ